MRWDWRKAAGGWLLPSDRDDGGRLFHAYDEADHAACKPLFGLAATSEEPNEGSSFCPDCMDVVRTGDRGRRSAG